VLRTRSIFIIFFSLGEGHALGWIGSRDALFQISCGNFLEIDVIHFFLVMFFVCVCCSLAPSGPSQSTHIISIPF
jgi:hypothetical protein